MKAPRIILMAVTIALAAGVGPVLNDMVGTVGAEV
jgi:hypothetical protein